MYKSNNLKKTNIVLKKSQRRAKTRPRSRNRAKTIKFLVESKKVNKTLDNMGFKQSKVKEKMMIEYNPKNKLTSPFFFIPTLRSRKNPQLERIRTYLVKSSL